MVLRDIESDASSTSSYEMNETSSPHSTRSNSFRHKRVLGALVGVLFIAIGIAIGISVAYTRNSVNNDIASVIQEESVIPNPAPTNTPGGDADANEDRAGDNIGDGRAGGTPTVFPTSWFPTLVPTPPGSANNGTNTTTAATETASSSTTSGDSLSTSTEATLFSTTTVLSDGSTGPTDTTTDTTEVSTTETVTTPEPDVTTEAPVTTTEAATTKAATTTSSKQGDDSTTTPSTTSAATTVAATSEGTSSSSSSSAPLTTTEVPSDTTTEKPAPTTTATTEVATTTEAPIVTTAKTTTVPETTTAKATTTFSTDAAPTTENATTETPTTEDATTTEKPSTEAPTTEEPTTETPTTENSTTEATTTKTPTTQDPTTTTATTAGGATSKPADEGDYCIDIQLLTDQFGSETGYTFSSADTGKVYFDYPKGSFESETLYEERVCVAAGKYQLTVIDDFRGVCCAFGEGYYSLSVDGTEIVRGGNFNENNKTLDILVGYNPFMSSRDEEWLDLHNTRRQEYHEANGVTFAPLVWSTTLAEEASAWIDQLMPKCKVESQQGILEGENLSGRSGSAPRNTEEPENILTRWVENQANKDYPDNRSFTQVMWRATRYLGCADRYELVTSSSGEELHCYISVCRYAKAGNCNVAKYSNWTVPVLSESSPCGPVCPVEGCF